MTNRTYEELMVIDSFEDRFRYLLLKGEVGAVTFGYDRYLNQKFYTSREWRDVRQEVIARDLGCDLAVEGYDIFSRPIIHHMNPMAPQDIIHGDRDILNPRFLITVTHRTHNAIHYGDENYLPRGFVERTPGDTKLW